MSKKNRNLEVAIEYNDQPENIVKIPLNRNSVLFGLNGKGKTRALRTIDYISKQLQSSRERILLNAVRNSNIKSLKINNHNYSRVFDGTSKFHRDISKNISKELKKNLYLLTELTLLLDEVLAENQSLSQRDSRRLFTYNETLKNFIAINEQSSDFSLHYPRSYEEIEFILRIIPRSIRSITRDTFIGHEFNESSFLKNLELHDNIVNISERILSILKQPLRNYDSKSAQEVIDLREELKKEFISGVHYVSANTDELEDVLEYIRAKIKSINESQSRKSWTRPLNHRLDLSAQNKFFRIIERINYQLMYFDDLQLVFDSRLFELSLKKNGNSIDFSKASSGERHLLSLFLNVAFREVGTVLIDEPEVSLSQNYHKRLINSLLELSEDTKNLIIATHAPYVYKSCKENDFEMISFDIKNAPSEIEGTA